MINLTVRVNTNVPSKAHKNGCVGSIITFGGSQDRLVKFDDGEMLWFYVDELENA